MTKEKTFHCKRPEAEDVRSALELGVDGFVLTSETASRVKDPETVVKALALQIKNDEKNLIKHGYYEKMREPLREAFHKYMKDNISNPDLPEDKRRFIGTTDSAIAAVFRANAYKAIGIFPFTANGGTVKEMCHFYPETQIFALTRNQKAAQLLLLYRCTHPILVRIDDKDLKDFEINELKTLVRDVVETLKLKKSSNSDDNIAINPDSKYAIATIAHPAMAPGSTDTLIRIDIE
jgi:pyruvate kinase